MVSALPCGIDEEPVGRDPSAIAADFSTAAEREMLAGTPGNPLLTLWCAKEAVAKALGAPAGMDFHDCQVSNGGQPTVRLSGTVAAAARDRGVATWHVSISHDGPVAVAYVIAEG